MANSLQEQYTQRQNESAEQINGMYDKQYAAQANQLKSDYERSLSDQQAAMKDIRPQYQGQANSLAASYEKQRRNAGLAAMNNGLGNGTAQQQQNALRNQYIQNYGGLRGQEAGAITQANQGIADLQTAYNNSLVKAQADIDAKRDQELVKNYNTNRDWHEAQAQNLANYGNFDTYKDLYGEAQANQMRNTWIAQNPEVALRSGMISKEEYNKLTGLSADLKNGMMPSIYQY